jgi:hypothetical protein
MSKMMCTLALGVGLSFHSRAEDIDKLYSTYGTLVLTQLASAPYPHASRAEGHTYKGEFFSAKDHYSDNTVAIFVPKGFREGVAVDYVVHFHGWRNTVPGTLKRYQLIDQLAASGRNAILVVPEGPHDAADSGGGRLEEQEVFKQLMADVEKALREKKLLKKADSKLGRIILSGHSGAYNVMSAIVAQGGLEIREVWLFDALYAQTERFEKWFEAEHGRLLDIYTKDGGTKKETEALMSSLKEKQASVLTGKEIEMALDKLPATGAVFIYSDLPHNDVLDKHRTFEQFLKTSCLGATSP